MGIELRLLGAEGEQSKVLPDVESLTLSPVLCDAGAIEFQYPVAGINAQHIVGRDEFELAVYLDGIRRPELDAIVKDVDGDDIEDDGVWKFSGFFNNGRLDEARTYPANWPGVDPEKPNLIFTSATAGTIVGTLMQQAHSRGTLLDIDYSSFSTTHDSNGVEWELAISLEFVPQVSYLDVLKNLYEQGLCEWQMMGKSLRLYVRDSMSEDRTQQDLPLVFRKGRDLVDSPRKRTTRELATAYLTAGAQGLYHEAVNETEVNKRRRIEGGSSQGNVSDRGTLIAYTDAQLERVSTPKMEKTHGLQFADEGTPRPMRHFNVGDWAYTDTGSGLERLRIKQWVIKNNADGTLSGSVTMNDFFAEQDEKTAKRVTGIIGGSTIAGGSRAEAAMPLEAADGIAPARPVGLTASSDAYIDPNGQTYAQVTASWPQVTTNEDGTILSDLDHYEVRWSPDQREIPDPVTFDESRADDADYLAYWEGLLAQGWTGRANDGAERLYPPGYDDTSWRILRNTSDTLMSWSPMAPGLWIQIQMRAVDKYSNASSWSDAFYLVTGEDVTAPPVPSTPRVDNYLGLLRVQWDGKFAFSESRPPDFDRVDVHVSDTPFEPSEATRVGPLIAPGSVFVGAPYGEVRYVRFVAYDVSGNASAASELAEGTSSQVVSSDVFDGAIGSAKLADLAVVTAKIADLAVNDAKIGSVSVGKLTAGVINAEVVIGGRLTTALAGSRVEMNSLGIYKWNAAGQQTVAIDDTGVLITGRYRSALSGRRVEMGASGSSGLIQFYNADGGVQTISSSTFQGAEVLQLRGGTQSLVIIGEDNKMSYWAWQMITIYRDNWFLNKGDSNLADNQKTVLAVNDQGHATFRPIGNGGLIAIQTASTTSNSPKLQLVTNSGFGGIIRSELGGDGVVRLQIRDVNDVAWGYLQAASFDVMSDERLKEEIRDVDGLDAILDQLMTVPIKKFKYKRDRTQELDPGPSRDHIGVLAQTLPAELVSGGDGEKSVDLAQLVFILLANQQRMMRQMPPREKGVNKP